MHPRKRTSGRFKTGELKVNTNIDRVSETHWQWVLLVTSLRAGPCAVPIDLAWSHEDAGFNFNPHVLNRHSCSMPADMSRFSRFPFFFRAISMSDAICPDGSTVIKYILIFLALQPNLLKLAFNIICDHHWEGGVPNIQHLHVNGATISHRALDQNT